MDSNIVLKVDNVAKKFTRSLRRSMLYGSSDMLKNMVGIKYNSGKLRKGEFWSVEGADFELKKGETLGLVGVNGSGKSTLLRILNGIYPPDKGKVSIRGRVGALIAVGAGFHPHMTGRENIYINGAILGMRRSEIDKKIKDIIDFADIGDFIDSPVATYSSGMSIRLGFSIAIHSDIDVLLADEILAVGDVNFQKKCFEKILEMRRNGISTILVSHSISQLERMCQKGVLLHQGRQLFYGDMRECIKHYVDIVDESTINKFESGSHMQRYIGVGNVEFSDVKVYQEGNDEDISNIEFEKNICIKFNYKFNKKAGEEYQLRLSIRTLEGRDVQKIIFQETPFNDGKVLSNEQIVTLKKEGTGIVTILAPKLFPQVFALDIAMQSLRMDVHEGGIANAAEFRIVEPEDKMYFEYGSMSLTQFDNKIKLN